MLPHLIGSTTSMQTGWLLVYCHYTGPYARIKPLPTYISPLRRYKYKKQAHLIWTVILYHYSPLHSPPKVIN